MKKPHASGAEREGWHQDRHYRSSQRRQIDLGQPYVGRRARGGLRPAGHYRDSIYIPFERDDEKYTFIDTAGVRKRGKIHEEVEKFSVVKTLQAIKDANVVIFVMDAREGVVDHDLNLLGFALEAGRAIVIALNKWDGMEPSEREYVKTELERRLFFVDFADIHFISALHGTGVGHLYKSVQAAFKSAVTRWPTSRLTQILEDAISEHQPPMVNGRRIKLRYAHLGGANPPLIVIHGNQTDKIPRSYSRYRKTPTAGCSSWSARRSVSSTRAATTRSRARRTPSPIVRSTRSAA